MPYSNYIIVLYANIIIAAICIFVVVWLAYQKNKYSYPSYIVETLPWPQSSVITTEYENIDRNTPEWMNDIRAFIPLIRQQSKEQLRSWQLKNMDPTFRPEMMIPKYFKDYYGDISIMQK